MPQGVVPLAQLLSVPRVLLPSVENLVARYPVLAAGPEKVISVSVWTRRLKAESCL